MNTALPLPSETIDCRGRGRSLASLVQETPTARRRRFRRFPFAVPSDDPQFLVADRVAAIEQHLLAVDGEIGRVSGRGWRASVRARDLASPRPPTSVVPPAVPSVTQSAC